MRPAGSLPGRRALRSACAAVTVTQLEFGAHSGNGGVALCLLRWWTVAWLARGHTRVVHRVLAARCCKSAYRAQQASVTGLRVCLSACAADECGLRLLTAQSALAPAAAASASSASCAADCSAAAEAATSCAVSMHLAQTLLQHGRFVQLGRYWLLARHSALPARLSTMCWACRAAHLFVSTLTALLLCSCCCVSESCAVVERDVHLQAFRDLTLQNLRLEACCWTVCCLICSPAATDARVVLPAAGWVCPELLLLLLLVRQLTLCLALRHSAWSCTTSTGLCFTSRDGAAVRVRLPTRVGGLARWFSSGTTLSVALHA
jgi:hypothetical protein